MNGEIVEGQVLAGKYRIERVLGVGGMGVVVSAHHLHLDQRVAIKFMLSEALANGEAVARFSREARAAVRIKSEHVARVSDVGVLDNGAPYMVMEYLEGKDLSAWLAQHGPLPEEQAVEFVLQASEAIAEAHSLGIVHRDLKPANLFVIQRPDSTRSVKVLDFGISKVTALAGSKPNFDMTRTQAIMGSPLYMSPEQMRSSRDADARSDIWALGVILYELVAGVPPFSAEALPELILKISMESPPPLRDRVPHASPGLEAVVSKCLERNPAQRFASIRELAIALADFGPARSRLSVERISGILGAPAQLTGGSGPVPLIQSVPSVPSATVTAASWGQTTTGGRGGKRALLVLGGFVSAGALVLGGIVVWRGVTTPEPSVSAPSASAVLVSSAPPRVSSDTPSAPSQSALAPISIPQPAAPLDSAESRAASGSDAAPSNSLIRSKRAAPSKTSPAASAPSGKPAKPAPPPLATQAPASKPKPPPSDNVFDDR